MNIELVPYAEKYCKAFKVLNEWWVKKYFSMEAMDHYYLDHPQKNIIAPGGYIVAPEKPNNQLTINKLSVDH